jgi:hypothetical protein
MLAGSLSLLFLARCSLTSLDGLTGGEGADAAGSGLSTSDDAAAPARDANVATSPSVDASVPPDAVSPVVSPPDAGGVVDTGAVSSGDATSSDASADDAGTVLFADDFEGAQALPRQWDLMTNADGTLTLDPSLFVSPPTSLGVTAQPLATGAPGNAANVTLRKLFTMPSAGTSVAYDFDAFAKQCDPTANAVIGALQISNGAGDLYELQLDVQRNAAGALGVIFAEYSGFADGGSLYVGHPVGGAIAIGVWTHVRIGLDLTQSPVARIYFNGALQLETPIDITFQGTAIQLSLGISYLSAPSTSWIVNYDDAVYRLLP